MTGKKSPIYAVSYDGSNTSTHSTASFETSQSSTSTASTKKYSLGGRRLTPTGQHVNRERESFKLPQQVLPVGTAAAQQGDEPTAGRGRSVVEVYGVPVNADTLDKALDIASTVRDDTSYGGKLSSDFDKEPKEIDLHDKMDDTQSIEVTWDGRDDREDNRQMSGLRKWCIIVLLAITVLQITLSSSIWAQASGKVQQEFHVSEMVATLGVTLYMVGIAIGPFFSSISEFIGKKPVFFVSFTAYVASQFMTVVGTNLQLLLAGRALTGFFGGIILVTSYGTVGDLFTQDSMGGPIVWLVAPTLLGPMLAPVISSFVSQLVSVQWVFRIMIIWSGVMMLLVFPIIPETSGPVLLARKAQRVRKMSKNPNFFAPIERERKNPFKCFFIGLVRPLAMLFTNGIMFYMCFYSALLMGILYSFFTAFPVVFKQVYDFKPQMQGISFLGVATGILVGMASQPFWTRCYRLLTRQNHGQDEAEYWLPQLIVGGAFVSGGLFMFGWTDWNRIHAVVPIVGTGLFGFGCLLSMASIYAYIVDGYRKYAVSGIAANIVFSGIFAAVFPLFAGDLMYRHVGVHWSPTIFGIVTALCIPMPVVLFVYGTAWRDRSKYSCNVTGLAG